MHGPDDDPARADLATDETVTARPSAATKWLLGCSLAVVVLGFSCVGCVWWAARSVETWVAEGFYQAVEEVIDESRLPPEQAASMRSDLERARRAVEEGRFGWRDLERLDGLERELQGLAVLGFVQYFDAVVIPESGLPVDEAAHASRTMQRVARAVDEGRLDPDEVDRSYDVDVELDRGQWRDEDVRRVVDELERLVDDLGIPDEPYTIDVASAFGRLVDRLLE